MGLVCSFNAFDGSYSSFYEFQKRVAFVLKGSCPPHYLKNYHGGYVVDEQGKKIIDKTLNPEMIILPDSLETNVGILKFLTQECCDSEILPDMCKVIADELEENVLPILLTLPDDEGVGSISHNGGYAQLLKTFIDGCRQSYEAKKPLEFK